MTFECDHPAGGPRARRIVSTTAIPEGLPPREIDDLRQPAMAAGEDLYHLDAGALAALDADLVVTQDLCAVCAVDVSVGRRRPRLPRLPRRGPHRSTRTPSTRCSTRSRRSARRQAPGNAADGLVSSLRERLVAVAEAVRRRRTDRERWSSSGPTRPSHPATGCPRWWPPPAAPALWALAGEKSVRITWDAVRASAPEVIVCAPCGYDLEGSATLAQKVIDDGELPHGIPVWAVDANASFARPGPTARRRRRGAGRHPPPGHGGGAEAVHGPAPPLRPARRGGPRR